MSPTLADPKTMSLYMAFKFIQSKYFGWYQDKEKCEFPFSQLFFHLAENLGALTAQTLL